VISDDTWRPVSAVSLPEGVLINRLGLSSWIWTVSVGTSAPDARVVDVIRRIQHRAMQWFPPASCRLFLFTTLRYCRAKCTISCVNNNTDTLFRQVPDLSRNLSYVRASILRRQTHPWGNTTFSNHSLTHGAEPFSRSCQLCSYSRTSQHFMEPGGSSPRSHKPSTGPYPEPDRFNPYHPILPL
jgi:hypothetical protein